MTNHSTPTHVRIAAIQWQMQPSSITELLTRVESFVKNCAGYQCDAILFPELFTLPLIENHRSPIEAIHHLAATSQQVIKACAQLAVAHRINIIAGSLPVLENGKLYNVSTFCHRDGRPHNKQYKLHPTPYEKREWNMQGGTELSVFDTDFGKVGILICYDVEFPELARLLSDQGMQILFVPFWTDSQNGYMRVRYCAQARAIEDECYVALAGAVGAVPSMEVIDVQHAQSAIFSPSDLSFPENAILAEAQTNIEMPVVTDLDLNLLDTLRREGAVQNSRDRRRDLYQINWLGSTQPGKK